MFLVCGYSISYIETTFASFFVTGDHNHIYIYQCMYICIYIEEREFHIHELLSRNSEKVWKFETSSAEAIINYTFDNVDYLDE